VFLRVADLTIHVACSQRDVHVRPGSAAAPFVVKSAPGDVRLDVITATLDADGPRDCVFDSGGPWRLYRLDDGWLFRFFSSSFGLSPYKTARLSSDFSSGQICLDRRFVAQAASVDPLEYPLDELLFISLLGQGRGVEIHGCGVVDRDSTGYLFVGQSGAGKTTMARLWLAADPQVDILSDDRVVLRTDAEGVWMYGTPWHGEEPLASPRRARLGGVFFLRHDKRDEVAPVGRVDGVARLFAASFPPFYDAAAVGFTLDFISAVLDGVPAVELRFAPTPRVLELVRRSSVKLSK
jgi:hypothetical protein